MTTLKQRLFRLLFAAEYKRYIAILLKREQSYHRRPIAEIAISNDRMDFVSIFLAND